MWLYLWLPMLSDGDIDYNRLSLTSTLYLCYFFPALSIRRNHICCDEFEKNSIKTVNARVLAGQTIRVTVVQLTLARPSPKTAIRHRVTILSNLSGFTA
ncbi:hypothetical protein Tco_0859686 [Tanacetum coccineum]|uniref:Uncharacterized protein n=1 Tax=Tanacetum coccineum TaxID=301880 RepID=A0ABQ5BGN9_9ASTR